MTAGHPFCRTHNRPNEREGMDEILTPGSVDLHHLKIACRRFPEARNSADLPRKTVFLKVIHQQRPLGLRGVVTSCEGCAWGFGMG